MSIKPTNREIISTVSAKSSNLKYNYYELPGSMLSQAIVSYHNFVSHIAKNYGINMFIEDLYIDIKIKMHDNVNDKPYVIKADCIGLNSAIEIAISAFNRTRHEQLQVIIDIDSIESNVMLLCFSANRIPISARSKTLAAKRKEKRFGKCQIIQIKNRR